MNRTLFHSILGLVLSVLRDIGLNLSCELADIHRRSVDSALIPRRHVEWRPETSGSGDESVLGGRRSERDEVRLGRRSLTRLVVISFPRCFFSPYRSWYVPTCRTTLRTY